MLYKFPVEWYCVWIVIIIIARLLPRLIEVGDATIDIGGTHDSMQRLRGKRAVHEQ